MKWKQENLTYTRNITLKKMYIFNDLHEDNDCKNYE